MRFDHGLTLQKIAAAAGRTPESLRPHLFGTLEADFDLGRLTPQEFFRAAERKAGLPAIADAVWTPAWRDIFTPVPSAVAALRRLERDVTPVLTSNTNALHWEGVLAVLPELPALVPLRALSFEIGAAKPDSRHFQAALDLAHSRPEDAFFADDRPDLVAAARSLGIDAFTADGPEALLAGLQERGLLSRADGKRFRGGDSPLFSKGVAEFRAGRYFEAHEEWELQWKDSSGDDRIFLQGLIQLAAALVHIGRGNTAPAERLLALAKAKLAPFDGEQAGIRIDSLFPL